MKALISVSDKTGLVPFAKTLVECGYDLISTGGTFKLLSENNIPVVQIDDVTGFPEMLDGRVKTLHPKIHGGLLALRDNETHMSICREHEIGLIDLVIVNLYPFKETIRKKNVTLEDAIENIDIGGPSMLRSASKNYRSVGVIVNPKRYDELSSELKENNGKLSDKTRAQLACEAFTHTAEYDTLISQYLTKYYQNGSAPTFADNSNLKLEKVSDLRYGENPHQDAALYQFDKPEGLTAIKQLHGKALSYNNYIDLEAAWHISREFEEPCATIIKHTNPCGTAIADTISNAYKKAYDVDPTSAFGSIIGLNKTVDLATAKHISETFVEAVIAPNFDQEAIDCLAQKPSIRLIELDTFNDPDTTPRLRHISGGILVQGADSKSCTKESLNAVTKTAASDAQIRDLTFAFNVIKHVKSNAIVLAKDGVIIGVGAGQMSRIESVEIAIKKAGDKTQGAIMASDAFFPFNDSVKLADKAGIKAIIQPGGSKRDQESIDFCNDKNIAMVFSGSRHFKH